MKFSDYKILLLIILLIVIVYFMNRSIKFLKNKVSELGEEITSLSKSSKNNLLALDSSHRMIEKLKEGTDQAFINKINKIEKKILNLKGCEPLRDSKVNPSDSNIAKFPTYDNNTKHFKIKNNNIKVSGESNALHSSDSFDDGDLSMQTGSENIAIYSNDNEDFCSNSEIEDTSSYGGSFDINMDEMESNSVKLDCSDFDDVELLETKKIHKSESNDKNRLNSVESVDTIQKSKLIESNTFDSVGVHSMQTSIINGRDEIHKINKNVDGISRESTKLIQSDPEKMVVNNVLTDEKKEELINSVRSSDNINESESNSKKSDGSDNTYSELTLNKMKLNELQCLAEEKDIVIVKINGKKKTKKDLISDLISSSKNIRNVQSS